MSPSNCSSRFICARSDVVSNEIASGGTSRLDSASAAISANWPFDADASRPPFRMHALPALKHRAKASTVTFGRAS